MNAQHYDAEARERLILWIRRRMDEFGITIEALSQACEAPVYRDARGNEWAGDGDVPDWLKAAENTGVDREFFRVQSRPQHARNDQDFPLFLLNH
jgi:DNA-binding protein H-NS